MIRKRSCVVRSSGVGKVPILVTRWLPTLLQARFRMGGVMQYNAHLDPT